MYFGCTVPICPTMHSSRWFVESRRVQCPLKIFTFVCLEYSRYDFCKYKLNPLLELLDLKGCYGRILSSISRSWRGHTRHYLIQESKPREPIIFSWPAEHEGHHKTWTRKVLVWSKPGTLVFLELWLHGYKLIQVDNLVKIRCHMRQWQKKWNCFTCILISASSLLVSLVYICRWL